MTVYKVLVDFSKSKYTDEELVTLGHNIVENMTDNTNFSVPNPALTTITTGTDAFEAAIATAKTGNAYDTAVKNEKRETLEALLKQEANFVQTTSNGNEAIILSSGFSVNKKASSVGKLVAPDNIKATIGDNRGSLKITWDKVDNARAYEVAYTEAPDTSASVWNFKTVTKHYVLIEGLTSGKQYAFKAAGIGSDESRIWSDIITSYVL